ncbi:retropepsin-like aspartic protease [Chitinophaga solisilvae]|uniref:retropepsin-like aspartic protease n=1 Tax=Chitinophaga solisilvae TaxID=1233460 RepID=UPI00136A31E6|nr:retropepsin-like aspartic protease [Chitinophaga solisilvae]
MWRIPGLIVLICITFWPAWGQRRKPVAQEETDQHKPLAVIPFSMVNRQVLIPVVLSGISDTLHFIFDTGAEVTVLDEKVATRMRLNKSRDAFMSGTNNGMIKTAIVSLNALYLKDLRIPYVKAYLENLSNLSADGVIGIDLLKLYTIRIDYRQQQLICYRKGKMPVGNTGRLLHFQLNYSTPVVDASITLPDGRSLPGHYHITTGGDYGILFNWPYVDKYKLNILPTINTDQVVDLARMLYYINSSLPSMQLGGKNISPVPVSYSKDINDVGVFTEVAGAIGYDIWKQFSSLTINYEKKELYLE